MEISCILQHNLKLNNMRKGLKFRTSKEFPIDFWNYHVNPITGFNTYELSNSDKDKKKYGIESQDLGL